MALSSIGTNLQTPECSIQLTGKASIPEYIYGHVHSSLRILVNISGPIKRHGVVNFVTL